MTCVSKAAGRSSFIYQQLSAVHDDAAERDVVIRRSLLFVDAEPSALAPAAARDAVGAVASDPGRIVDGNTWPQAPRGRSNAQRRPSCAAEPSHRPCQVGRTRRSSPSPAGRRKRQSERSRHTHRRPLLCRPHHRILLLHLHLLVQPRQRIKKEQVDAAAAAAADAPGGAWAEPSEKARGRRRRLQWLHRHHRVGGARARRAQPRGAGAQPG